ncbi:hypothetical protein ScPMuIL_002693 [Solemya velum]
MGTGDCPEIASVDDAYLQLDTQDVSNGTTVHIACRAFANRLTLGYDTVYCENGNWSPAGDPVCEYTGELSLYEQIVVGVLGASGVFLVILLLMIALCGVRFRKKLRDQRVGVPLNFAGTDEFDSPMHKHNDHHISPDSRSNGIYDQGPHINKDPHSGPYVKVADGYVYYTGRQSTENQTQSYDNRSYEPRGSGHPDDLADPIKHGNRPFSYTQEDKYQWDGHIPRPTLDNR